MYQTDYDALNTVGMSMEKTHTHTLVFNLTQLTRWLGFDVEKKTKRQKGGNQTCH